MSAQGLDIGQMRFLSRRGLKELDVLLNQYLEQHFLQATLQEKQSFVNLLQLDDHSLLLKILHAEKEHLLNRKPCVSHACEQRTVDQNIYLKIKQLQINTNLHSKNR